MSNRHPLSQPYYQESIHLNDRPYGLLDIGDGSCKVILVTGINEADYSKGTKLGRRIIIDISESWGYESHLLAKQDLEQLADDLRLLLDVFWLDCVVFDTTLDGLDLSFIENRLTAHHTGDT
jgi:hypothetical protein